MSGKLAAGLFFLLSILTIPIETFTRSAHSTVIERVIAVVNQEVITLSELETSLRQLENPLFQQLYLDASAPPPDQQPQEALRRLIEKKLLLQAARRRGIIVDQGEVEQALKEIKQRQGIPSDAALDRILSQNETSLSQYTQEVRDHLMILKLIEREVRFNIVIRDEDIFTFYQSRQEQFMLPQRFQIAQILLALPADAGPQQAEQIRQKAEEVRSRILEGEDFDQLAQKLSDGPQAQQAGNLGYFSAGDLREEIERAVSGLQPGQVSDVVRTPKGFHIFKLLDRKNPQSIPLDQLKPQVQQQLFLERSQTAYQEWLKGLRDQAYVEVRM